MALTQFPANLQSINLGETEQVGNSESVRVLSYKKTPIL